MAGFFEDFFTGGAASRNEAAQAQVENQKKNIKANYTFQWGDPNSGELGGEQLRIFQHHQNEQEILKKNTYGMLDQQDAQNYQNWEERMAIRNYEDRQATRLFDQSVSRAIQQKSFTELATNAALVDQDRLLNEQLLSITFDETESLLEYGAAAAGLGLKKRQIKGAAATQAQADRIATLKATGAAAARGVSGRSAGKIAQGMLAESGARQAAIIDELMYNTEGADIDFMRLNRQYAIDQIAYQTSRESAKMSDTQARSKIKMQELQSLLDAEASIHLKPEAQPALSEPLKMYRPEFGPVFKPGKPPMTQVADAAQENLWAATFNQFSQNASLLMGAFGGGGGGGGGGSGISLSGISPMSEFKGATYGMGAASGAFSGASGLGSASFGSFGGGSFGVGSSIGKFKPL